METKEKRILFNITWWNLLRKFSDASRLKMYDAIFEYAATGKARPESDFDSAENIAFAFITREMDFYLKSYEERFKEGIQGKNSMRRRQVLDENKEKGKEYKDRDKDKEKDKEKEKESLPLFCEESIVTDVTPRCATREERKMIRKYGGLTNYRLKTLLQDDSPYGKFNKWLIENAEFIVDHYRVLITEKNYTKLISKYSLEAVCTTILEVENRVDLRKKYTNLYLTILKWLKNGYEPYK